MLLLLPVTLIGRSGNNTVHCLVFCQTLGLVLRLRVDFVLPLSQEQEQEEEQQEPPTKIYQMGVY